MLGPPPSSAGPSEPSHENSRGVPGATNETAEGLEQHNAPFVTQTLHSSSQSSRGRSTQPDVNVLRSSVYTEPTHYPSDQFVQHQGQAMPQQLPHAYYNFSPNTWAHPWSTGTYQYGIAGAYQYPYPVSHTLPQAPHTGVNIGDYPLPEQKPLSTSPPPSPPPESLFPEEWDAAISSFLLSAGLTQALRGFRADMIVMNPEWERRQLPVALGQLTKDLLRLGASVNEGAVEDPDTVEPRPKEPPLEQRKLGYVNLTDATEPRSQTSRSLYRGSLLRTVLGMMRLTGLNSCSLWQRNGADSLRVVTLRYNLRRLVRVRMRKCRTGIFR